MDQSSPSIARSPARRLGWGWPRGRPEVGCGTAGVGESGGQAGHKYDSNGCVAFVEGCTYCFIVCNTNHVTG